MTIATHDGTAVLSRDGFFIDGSMSEPLGDELLTVTSPSTEQPIGHVPLATTGDVDRAVAAAKRAWMAGDWASESFVERADLVARALRLLAGGIDEIGRVVTHEMGIPISVGSRYVSGALKYAQSVVDVAREIVAEEPRLGQAPFLVRREPVGVVGAIAPWNAPFLLALTKITPALVTGCSVVFKPAAETPLDAYYVAEAFAAAGLPDGVLNVVPGGREIGEHLVRHPDVDKISFTGSTAVGRRIGALCGEQLKRCQLELGGKSAAVILDDADLDVAVPAIAGSAFRNSGQICVAMTRALAPASAYDEIVSRFVACAERLVVGDPFDERTEIGPLVSERQRTRVEGFLDAGVAEGALAVCGGGRPADLAAGWYVEPTVFRSVEPTMTIAQEEIFGPVLSVITYDDVDDAVAIANATRYGLNGGVFTTSDDRALDVARRVRTGMFMINGMPLDAGAPVGGMKQSGVGREGGAEGLAAYTELKSVSVSADVHRRLLLSPADT